MKKIGRTHVHRYSSAFREKVIRSILEEGLSVSEARKRYGFSRSQTLYRWLDELEKTTDSMSKKDNSSKQDTSKKDADQSELEALREELRLERLRSAAYKQMIKQAEAYFNIRIEKKSGSKPSRK